MPGLPAVVGSQDLRPRDADRTRAGEPESNGEAVRLWQRTGRIENGGVGEVGSGEWRGGNVGSGDGATAAEELEGCWDWLGRRGGRRNDGVNTDLEE